MSPTSYQAALLRDMEPRDTKSALPRSSTIISLRASFVKLFFRFFFGFLRQKPEPPRKTENCWGEKPIYETRWEGGSAISARFALSFPGRAGLAGQWSAGSGYKSAAFFLSESAAREARRPYKPGVVKENCSSIPQYCHSHHRM